MNAPWPLLGIDRTDDRRAIRKAYAARLKAIDVESDPAAFIALRQALERALSYAAEREWYEANGETPPADDRFDAADETALARDDETIAADLPEIVFDDDAWAEEGDFDLQRYVPPLPDEGNERFRRFDQLLFGLDGEAPDPDALIGATRDILDHLGEVSIDRAAAVEYWLAESTLAAIPRSDPILDMLVAHFRWDKTSGRLDQPYAFEEIVQRVRGWDYFGRLSRPDHPLHDAWRDLTSPKETLGVTSFLRRDQVFRLLDKIRRECPDAEAQLAPHRVALWDERLRGGGRQFRVGWGFLAVWLIIMLLRLVNPQQQPALPPPAGGGPVDAPLYADVRGDIGAVIESLGGDRLQLVGIERENPEFYRRLVAIWRERRDGAASFETLRRDIGAELDQAYSEGLRAADGGLLDQHWQLVRDRLAWLRRRPADCASFMTGGPGNYDFPLDLENRAAALRATIILHAPATPQVGSAGTTFAIPPAIFADARGRAHLSERDMSAALNGRGTAAQRCEARIALIEAALQRGEAGRRMLREATAAS